MATEGRSLELTIILAQGAVVTMVPVGKSSRGFMKSCVMWLRE